MNRIRPSLIKPVDVTEQIRKDLVVALGATILGLAIPLSILHDPSVGTYGISEFGVHVITAIPLGVGLFIASFYLWKIADQLRSTRGNDAMTQAFRALSVLITLIVLTPFTVDTLFNWLPMTIGALLFLDQLALSVHILRVHNVDKALILFFAVELIGGVLAALSLPDNWLSYMFQGEVLFQIGFILMLFRGLTRLVEAPLHPRIYTEDAE